MSQFHRYGHCDKLFFASGDKVKKGQLIGTVGTGNGQWSAHLHFDCPKSKLTTWTGYVFGWTLQEVKDVYADPGPYRSTVFPAFDHFGWLYLDLADYDGKKCYHPGEDLNGKGAGNSDIGDFVYSACDGTVVYCYNGTGKNGGWGKLLVIEEAKIDPPAPEKSTDTSTPTEEPIVQPESISDPTAPVADPYPIAEAGIPYEPEKVENWFILLLRDITNLLKSIWKK